MLGSAYEQRWRISRAEAQLDYLQDLFIEITILSDVLYRRIILILNNLFIFDILSNANRTHIVTTDPTDRLNPTV